MGSTSCYQYRVGSSLRGAWRLLAAWMCDRRSMDYFIRRVVFE
jgi:hypothetical protein